MRKFNKLKRLQKLRRLWHAAKNIVWGGYRSGGLSGAYHWVRCHTWNRYHVIKLSGADGYDWGWIDRDHALLLASFQILKEFVEKEDPRVGLRTLEDYGHSETEANSFADSLRAQVEDEKEIRALYLWWLERSRSPSHSATDWDLGRQDDEMLIRLIKVRQRLWT